MSAQLPDLWHETPPRHFDAAIAWWLKAAIVALATFIAIQWIDQPVAEWALTFKPLENKGGWNLRGDIRRELAMLEQWGQWVCTSIVITAVFLIDKNGRRRAIAIAVGCLATVLVTQILKDLCGRSRPDVLFKLDPALTGHWLWGGPKMGFTKGSSWGSFPSAHTTGAFALSVSLAWFYPRARALFMTLATITAIQRVLNHAHYVSDVIGGMGISVLVTRWTFQSKLAGRLIKLLPPKFFSMN